MTRTLVILTARHLFSRRRALAVSVLALVPVLVAVIYRLGSEPLDPLPVEFAPDILDAMVIAAVLPIAALVFGTAALGAEIEDGTAVYLLTKPIPRWRILVVKVVVAAAATIAVATPATLVSAVVILDGDEAGLTPAFAVAITVGAIAYSSLFVGLSAVTSRALLIGLGYVFIWEAIVTSIFEGTRWVSVRQYMLGIADLISSAPSFALEAEMDGAPALALSLVVIGLSVAVGIRFLERFEIGERL